MGSGLSEQMLMWMELMLCTMFTAALPVVNTILCSMANIYPMLNTQITLWKMTQNIATRLQRSMALKKVLCLLLPALHLKLKPFMRLLMMTVKPKPARMLVVVTIWQSRLLLIDILPS